MDPFNLVLIVLVAAGAFAAGYFIGHFKALAEVRTRGHWAPDPSHPSSPLPGPEDSRYGEAAGGPSRPRGAPPPASAGGSNGAGAPGARRAPRRSIKPPPAIAGLMNRIIGNKRDGSQK